ncbi:thrombospondin type 3 repeat-containing protein [Chondromyces apiculatus]|uniref:OmpA-like domain-containing protein n=1 Tax=Chondromyces apiculatus DSM 436 TaxID=1192034 RepID=A0A017T2C5_9BACT|nr:thrombospondin type 3 repeat-containing protein [Chondromyces apiculatus]EYF03122.1 Hypothetical protein CAP_6236 [Chondromyces apiculatus DSM 436]
MRSFSGGILASVLVASLVPSVPSAASAAPVREGVRLDVLQPASPESHFIRAESPHTPNEDAVEFAASASVEYASRPVRAAGVDSAEGEVALGDPVRHAVLARVGASVTPGGVVSLDLSVPFAVYTAGEGDRPISYAGQQISPASGAGLGDPRFGLHARVLDRGTFDLLLGGRVWVPVGSEGTFMSDKRLRGELDVGVACEAGPVLCGGMISVAPGLFTLRDGDRAAAAFAVHVLPVPAFSLGVEPSVVVLMDERPDASHHAQIAVEALAAMRLKLGAVRLGLAGGPVFGNAAGTGELRGVFTVGVVGSAKSSGPRTRARTPSDRDFDGVLDAQDACPAEAGPDSKDPSLRGCPVRDQDSDDVRDEEDACRERPGVKHPDPRANGCPDGDNDTVPDPLDGCPREPGAAPFGCPRYARLEGDRFKMEPPLVVDGPALSRDARAALEEVAATVRANPRIAHVTIGIGTKGVSAQAADERARAILLVLRAGYLDQSRYEVELREDLKAGVVEITVPR